jgi:hypothetical protein
MAAGDPVFIQGTLNPLANGWFRIEALTANTSFTYFAAGQVTNVAGGIWNQASTYIYKGFYFTNAGIQLSVTNAFSPAGTTVTVTTANPHGLAPNDQIYVTGVTGTNPPNGAWVVATVPTANSFTFTSINASSGLTNPAGNACLYARPTGGVDTRPFDGGVQFTAGANVPNAQMIRQTRRYFRYQSGKGIQFSTGSSLKPAIQVQSLTASSYTVTVTTVYPHNLTAGTVVTVANANQTEYNGTWTILTTPTSTTFTYQATTPPSVSPATTSSAFRLNPVYWWGSANRVGIFDQQNGLFFEFDGQTLYACRRSSTTQITGVVQVTQGNGLVTGIGTAFSSQLTIGDFIVIRGQSYRVINIASDTQLYISPEYRGASYTGATTGGYQVSKTIDTKVPQSQWWDPCDGTGPSGYVLDTTKMQMWYIDYSWYGAGVARFGFRAQGGAVTYVYAFQHNNNQYEAYMRSGNLPAHYESNGFLPITTLSATLANTAAVGSYISVNSTAGFPLTGQIRITNAGQTGTAEVISYDVRTSNSFRISARAQTGGQASAQTFTYSATAPVGVELVYPDAAVPLAHWGSSSIMDGRFDDDKSLLFNYGMTTSLSIAAAAQVPLLALRIGPSVDTGQVGLLGNREIINHMQLQATELAVITTGTFLIQAILNGYTTTFSGTFGKVSAGTQTSSSLAQIAVNTTTTASITGGESVAAAFTNTSGQTTLDLTQVRDIGNSILGGGLINTVPTSYAGVYPDGPDILYIVATNVGASAASVQARVTWKEAQA